MSVELSPMRRFLKFFHFLYLEEKDTFWVLVIYGVWVSVCSLVVPIAVQTFVNTIGFGLLIQPIIVLTLIVLMFLTFSGVMRALQVFLAETLQHRLFTKITLEMAHRLPRLAPQVLHQYSKNIFANRFFDITVIQKAVTFLILDGSVVVLQIFFGMILLAFYHPFLLALNVLIISFILIFFIRLTPRAIESNILESKAKHQVGSWLQEMSQHADLFRSADAREFALQQTDQFTHQYLLKARKHFMYLFQQTVAAIGLQIAVSVLLLGVGGWLVTQGQLTLGQLVASELVVSSVVSGIGKFGKYLESYYELAGALDKLGELFELPLERLQGDSYLHRKNEVFIFKAKALQLKGESFKSMNPLDFDLKLGSKLGIVGSSRSGKSYLLRVLYGLEDPYAGYLELEGIQYQYRTLDSLRRSVFYISEVQFFDGTLLDNLRVYVSHSLERSEIDLYRIQEVLQSLGLEKTVHMLPQGLYTRMTSGHYPLTKTEAKKMMLARALLAQPKVLLLDDFLDTLDPNEDECWSKFLKSVQPFAMILTARYQKNVHGCDRCILMQEGVNLSV